MALGSKMWHRMALLALVICSPTVAGVASGSDLRQRLTHAQALWIATGPKNYSYIIDQECQLCGSPVEVVVKDGACFSVRPVSHSMDVTCSDRTVPELLKSIRAWAGDDSGSTIEATFDGALGYPLTWFIQTNVVQDTESVRIREFTVLGDGT